jgi:hypothetical protein
VLLLVRDIRRNLQRPESEAILWWLAPGHILGTISAEALEAVPPAAISLIDQIANQDHVGRPGPITSPPSKQTEQMASAASGSWHGLIA